MLARPRPPREAPGATLPSHYGTISSTARVAAAKYALASIGHSSTTGAVKLAKKALAAEAERQAELPTARAKLERLIESRAEELAEAMTEERIAELVEERANEFHEEQKARELVAVRAELEVNE